MSRRSREDRAWKDFEASFRTEGLPKILESAVCMTIHTGDGRDYDVKQAVEIGAILLLDKPLILVVATGASLPTRLARAADVVIEDWDPDNHDAQARLTAAVTGLAPDLSEDS